VRMKETYIEGLTTHNGPESCARVSNNLCEALIGVHAGWPLSRDMDIVRGADPVGDWGRQYPVFRFGKEFRDPARSETPCMHVTNLCENREILRSSLSGVDKERVTNSKEVRSQ